MQRTKKKQKQTRELDSQSVTDVTEQIKTNENNSEGDEKKCVLFHLL